MLNIYARSAPLRSIQRRMYHSIAKSGVQATEGQKAVMVYDSPEFESFSGASASSHGIVSSWDSLIMSSPYKKKFFSLLPFQIESVSYFIDLSSFRNSQINPSF